MHGYHGDVKSRLKELRKLLVEVPFRPAHRTRNLSSNGGWLKEVVAELPDEDWAEVSRNLMTAEETPGFQYEFFDPSHLACCHERQVCFSAQEQNIFSKQGR